MKSVSKFIIEHDSPKSAMHIAANHVLQEVRTEPCHTRFFIDGNLLFSNFHTKNDTINGTILFQITSFCMDIIGGTTWDNK
jgi:hypothetical protein